MVPFIGELVLMVLLFMTAALASTWALLKGLGPRQVVLTGALLPILLVVGFSVLYRENPQEDLAVSVRNYFGEQQFEKSWDQFSKAFVSQDVTAEQRALVKAQYRKNLYDLMPGWAIAQSIVFGLWAYYLVSFLLTRISQKVPAAVLFRHWTIPDTAIFGLILGIGLKTISNGRPFLEILGGNLVVVFGALYVLGGFSVISFYFHQWRFPAVLRILSYVTLAQLKFMWMPMELVCTLGILDIWFDFRKLKTPKPEALA